MNTGEERRKRERRKRGREEREGEERGRDIYIYDIYIIQEIVLYLCVNCEKRGRENERKTARKFLVLKS